MISPDIRELQYFLALVKGGSFSSAAKLLGVTQPAVSAQIAKLEQMIGFPLFYRCPEGTEMTKHGRALVPLIQDIEREYSDLMRRAAYWKRSRTKQVKIRVDGSIASQNALREARTSQSEAWDDLSGDTDWISDLRQFEVDLVIAGSFLKAGQAPGIRTHVIKQQRGITIAWNPAYYSFEREPFSFPDALAATIILPVPAIAIGFREFLSQWCETAYGYPMVDFIECRNEQDALETCKLGLGVMMFPGDAEERMKLKDAGLQFEKTFEFLLPKAFTFGIRHRADEQNPRILAAVEELARRLGATASIKD